MSKRLILLLALGLAGCDSRLEGRPQESRSEVASPALRMPTPRAAHSAVALADGRVLLIGGCVEESCEAGPDSATADAYDPATGRFARAGTLTARRLSAAVLALPSGQILIAGGWTGPQVSSIVELFNPATGRSRQVATLSVARSDIAAAQLPDGRILLAGGYDGDRPVGTVEIFDPRTLELTSGGALVTARAGAGAALLKEGKVLLAGGAAEGGRPTASAEIYDPATGRSTATGSLAQARYKHAVVPLADGTVLAIGGSDHRDNRGKLSSVERFDPATGTFRAAGSLAEPRYKIAAAVQVLRDGRILVAGGGTRPEIFDPATGRSRYVAPEFGKRLNFATATLLRDGSVLVAGGYDESGIRMSSDAWIVPSEAGTASR